MKVIGKRSVILIALIAALATLGFANGQQASGGDAAAAPAASGPVKITVWHSFVGADQRAAFMERRMAEFRAANPNIEIDEQKIPRDQYQTKLKTLAAAGELPDGFLIWPNAMTKEFANAGLLADINSLLAKETAWKNSLLPRALEEFTVNGKTYTAGLGVSITSIVFYNKALFDKHGVKVPTTYDELKTAVKTFTAAGVIPIAHGNKPKWPAQSCIFSLLANRYTGSQWLGDALANKGAKFTDKPFVDALNALQELAALGAFNRDYNSVDDVQMRDYFFRGEAAMMIGGSWILPGLIANAPAELKANVRMTVLPSVSGGSGDQTAMSGVSSTGIAINAKASPEKKAALEKLIVFLTNDDAQQIYTLSNIPVSSKTVVPDPTKVDPLYTMMVDLIKAHPLVTVYDSALNSEQTEIVNNGLQGVMLGAMKPADLAAQLQATIK
jgi:raffinose/stachyose/melibiose transport system substrate-binding protein